MKSNYETKRKERKLESGFGYIVDFYYNYYIVIVIQAVFLLYAAKSWRILLLSSTGL